MPLKKKTLLSKASMTLSMGPQGSFDRSATQDQRACLAESSQGGRASLSWSGISSSKKSEALGKSLDALDGFPFHPLFAFQMYGSVASSFIGASTAFLPDGFHPFGDCNPKERDLWQRLKALQTSTPASEWTDFCTAVQREAFRRLFAYLQGLQTYTTYRSHVTPKEAPVLAQVGQASLKDYGAHYGAPLSAKPVLFVPSLMNRGFIFDLLHRQSFFFYLVQKGMRPLLVEWGEMTSIEAQFALGDYIDHRLSPLLEDVFSFVRGRLPVVGYCMGGLLALGEALNRKEISALGLFAVPWNFQTNSLLFERWIRPWGTWLGFYLEQVPVLHAEFLQLYFHLLDPLRCIQKFQKGRQKESSRGLKTFTALENWIRETLPLSGKVAQEILNQWYLTNTPYHTHHLAGKVLDFSEFQKPVLAVLPQNDHIVPTASAEALLKVLSSASVQVLRPPLGHVGMLVSRSAQKQVWEPFVRWLRSV